MKIAIIDSGIIENPIFSNHINKFFNLYINGNYILESSQIIDEYGHGTLCASTILKYCPNSIFDIYKISDNEGNAHIDLLILALEKILEQRKTKLLNISMSFKKDSVTSNDFKYIQYLFNSIRKRGTIVISSVDNNSWLSYPSSFYEVIGVYGKRNNTNENKFFYSKKNRLFWTSNVPYLHMDHRNNYTLFGASNSYCSAKTTGLIASQLSKEKKHLYMIHRNISNNNIYKSVIKNIKYVNARVINGYVHYNDIKNDTYIIAKNICFDLHIDLNFYIMTSFSLYDFITIDRICNKFMEVIRCQYL